MLKLKAKIRKQINRNNKIPGIIYGNKIKNILLEVDYSEFEKIYKKAGESALISLLLNNKSRNVLIHDVQIDPVSDKYIHVDFYAVRLDQAIKAEVALHFIGQAPAVDERGGILVKNMDQIEVRALPKDLPHEILVDVSNLKQIDDAVFIKDLLISKNVEILEDTEQPVAIVVAPKVQEEEKKADQAEPVAEGEEKKEGEETAQGEEQKQESSKSDDKKNQ